MSEVDNSRRGQLHLQEVFESRQSAVFWASVGDEAVTEK